MFPSEGSINGPSDAGSLPAGLGARGHLVSASQAVVIGAGPAGLMAAEVLAGAGVQVDVFDGEFCDV